MPFLSGALPPKKTPGSAPASVACLLIHDFEHFSEQSNSVISTVVRKPSCFVNVYLDINSTNMSSSKELNLMLFCIAKRDKYL